MVEKKLPFQLVEASTSSYGTTQNRTPTNAHAKPNKLIRNTCARLIAIENNSN